MTRPKPSPELRHRQTDSSPAADFATDSAWENAADRAGIHRLGVSGKFPRGGMHGGEKDPEIYAVYQPVGQNREHQVEACEVCGKTKEDCAC